MRVTFVVSALLLATIGKRETIAPPPATTSFVDDVRTGIRVVWRNRDGPRAVPRHGDAHASA